MIYHARTYIAPRCDHSLCRSLRVVGMIYNQHNELIGHRCAKHLRADVDKMNAEG